MLDIGWSEMAVIALVALVVIGPRDLPRVMRTLGKWAHKARAVSREFQSGIDEMIRETDLEDARKALNQTRSGGLERMVENTIDPKGTLKKEAQEIERSARDDQPAAAAKPAAAKSEGEPAEAPKATIVKQPTQIAPPHSVRPPVEPSGAAATGDASAGQETGMAAVPGKKSA